MNSWVWIAIIVIVLAVVLYSFAKLGSSRNWESTEGTVVSASIEEIYRNNTQQNQVGDQSFNYKVTISYQYKVGGQTFTGDQLTAGLPNIVSNRVDADDLLQKYVPNASAEIFYNPKQPNESALITGKSIPIAGFVIFGVMIILIGGGIGFIVKSGILN
jgi:preprotein translocase subunit SecF